MAANGEGLAGRFAGFDEIQIGAGRSDIPAREVIVDHDPGLRQVAHHGHVATFPFIGPGRIPFLRNDLGGIDIQGVLPAFQLTQTLGHNPAIHPVQARQSGAFSGTAQPVTRRVRAGQSLQMQQAAEALVRMNHAQILQRTAATGQHQ